MRRGRWAPAALLTVVAAACSGGFGDAGVVLELRSDGREELRFNVGRCGSDRAGFEVEQLDDRVVIEIWGPWNDGDDCSFGGDVVLDEPLGDRLVVLSGPDTRHARCEGAPEGVPQTLCQGDETEFSTWAPPRPDPPRPDVIAATWLSVDGTSGRAASPCPFGVAVRLTIESHVDGSITHRVLLVDLLAEVFDWPADETLDIGQPTWSQSIGQGRLLDDVPLDELLGSEACDPSAVRPRGAVGALSP